MEIQNSSNIQPSGDPSFTPQPPAVAPSAIEQAVPAQAGKAIKLEGRVIEALPNAFFKVVLQDGREIIGFLSGKMRLNRIKILIGDKVTLEMSPYDDKKGRIVYRLK